MANENDVIIELRTFVYESNNSVARVATGFFLPISRANLALRSLAKIMITTREIRYTGKVKWSNAFQVSIHTIEETNIKSNFKV